MTGVRPWVGLLIAMVLLPDAARSEDLGLVVKLAQAVPYRIVEAAAGQKVSVEYQDTKGALSHSSPGVEPRIQSVSEAVAEPGWRQVVFVLTVPHSVVSTSIDADGEIRLRLRPLAGSAAVKADSNQSAKPLIMLDPGHGGIDSGAVRDGAKESDLMLSFALELSDALVRTGRFRVALTRNDDRFLRLTERIDAARMAGAAALLSLHADALEDGKARGAAVFTLSETASDAAAAELVEAHDRADLLAGHDLGGTDDEIARVLIDLAQRDNSPRSAALAQALVDALSGIEGTLRKRANQSANFGVLKAPDIPSVLIELGFMSDARDLENLLTPEWRTRAADALRDGLVDWADWLETADTSHN